jgi:dihydroorotate dehydrogenase
LQLDTLFFENKRRSSAISMVIELLAKAEKFVRPLVVKGLPAWWSVFYFTTGRKIFLSNLAKSRRAVRYLPPEILSRTLWGVDFRSPLFNAAGMFKLGEGYQLVASQGAGAYLCGTTTSISRKGNSKHCLSHPVATFPQSGASINWMGLPNPSHTVVARRISKIQKVRGCPIGASLGSTPEHSGELALAGLLDGMKEYALSGADFLEINESCPNVAHETADCTSDGLDASLVRRLECISQEFLADKHRSIPVIVKFSVDTDAEKAKALTRKLIELGYDGVNFGNTSTDYSNARQYLNKAENKVLDYFTREFGGGLSGAPLRQKSLDLIKIAKQTLLEIKPEREFHIVRTGGIETGVDLAESITNGADLCQWFAGYFSNFSEHGHNIYQEIYRICNEHI